MEVYNDLTYEQYCNILDDFIIVDDSGNLNEGVLDQIKGVRGKIGKILLLAKGEIATILKETDIPIRALVKAFRDRDIFAVLKHFGFSILAMIKSIQAGAFAIKKGYARVFKEMYKNGTLRKLKSGAMKVDEVLDKYPILKKLSGVAVAGMLLLIWLNISFIGNFDYDFDIGDMFTALTGSYSIEKLFTSPDGLAAIAFVATNIASGGVLSVSWLGATHINFILALTYTALKKSGVKPASLTKFKKYIGGNKVQSFKEWKKEENTNLNESPLNGKEILKRLDMIKGKVSGKDKKSIDRVIKSIKNDTTGQWGDNSDKMILMNVLYKNSINDPILTKFLKEDFMMSEEKKV